MRTNDEWAAIIAGRVLVAFQESSDAEAPFDRAKECVEQIVAESYVHGIEAAAKVNELEAALVPVSHSYIARALLNAAKRIRALPGDKEVSNAER